MREELSCGGACMEEVKWDAVVVGAGPAGSKFSMELAKKGFSVLMLDRRREIGIPVRCGEGTGQKVLDAFKLKPNPEWAHYIKGLELISPSGNKLRASGSEKGYVVERRVMDKLMALKAVEAGAKLLTGTTVVGLDGTTVTAESMGIMRKFTGRLIVAADGVESYVARMAGLAKNIHPHDLDSCFQYEMQGIKLDPTVCQFYFTNTYAPRGYVWIFPKGNDRANVGVGIAGDDPIHAKEYLDKFISANDDLKNASITQLVAGNITVSKPLEKLVKDNLMVIGTAARQVNPVNGGGIGDAVKGATVAAPIAIKCLGSDDLKSIQPLQVPD